MYARNIYHEILAAIRDTPVVFIEGGRQTGKTTLLRQLSGYHYVTMDVATTLAAAKSDPAGFLAGLPKPAAIDEVQRTPELLLAIKADVDRNRLAGRYVLTGSANVFALPAVADSLAGRLETIRLNPLSQGELAGVSEDARSRLFAEKILDIPGMQKTDRFSLVNAISMGGFPEIQTRSSQSRRERWFESYVTTLLDRDVRDIARVHDVSQMLRLVRFLAARSGSMYSQAEVSRSCGLPVSTLSRYVHVLENLYLAWFLPAWSGSISKRFAKTPKVHMTDSGLCCFLNGADRARLEKDHDLAGRLAESFVASELKRQAAWARHRAEMYHYRTHNGEEIDIVLEDMAGRLAAVEVKLTASVSARELRGITALKNATGGKFANGVVACLVQEVIPLADRIYAVPITWLFAGGDQAL